MGVKWPIEGAENCDFGIGNIPFGIFSTVDFPSKRAGTAIGHYVLDLSVLEHKGLFSDFFGKNNNGSVSTITNGTTSELAANGSHREAVVSHKSFFDKTSLNDFATLPASQRSGVRSKIISLLKDKSSFLFENTQVNEAAFWKQNEVVMHLPMEIGDFSDFMCARVHVDNCSRMANAKTPPSFYAMPTAYNGRASSVIVSGTPIHRPRGMLRLPPTTTPGPAFEFAASRRMDYELEMGIFISKPVPFGHTIDSADAANEHIFGFVMLNDWSARDIQFAEMTPLGPFNGKGSGTTISPWVVTLDALRGCESEIRDEVARNANEGLPAHLRHEVEKCTWNVEVGVGVRRGGGGEVMELGKSNLAEIYWTPGQMIAHHASSGCGLRTGDLLGTGTISSKGRADAAGEDGVASVGCLHELTAGGTMSVKMRNGDAFTWLEDGDEVVLTGSALGADGKRIGFGDCTGLLKGAL